MFLEEIRVKQDLSYISFSSLRFINNSKFILNATSLGSNGVLIIRVQSGHVFDES